MPRDKIGFLRYLLGPRARLYICLPATTRSDVSPGDTLASSRHWVWLQLVSTSTGPVRAQQIVDSQREYKVKAVFVYSFGRFTTWPAEPTEGLTIGVFGQSQISDTLERIAGKRTLKNGPIKINRYTSYEQIRDADCHILFVSRSVDSEVAAQIFKRLGNRPVLTVTESSSHRLQGSVLNFVLDGDGVHFEINIDEAQRKALKLDARLLRQGKRMEL